MLKQKKYIMNQELINKVILQMKNDFAFNEFGAVEVLLNSVPKEDLISFLPEEQQAEFEKND